MTDMSRSSSHSAPSIGVGAYRAMVVGGALCVVSTAVAAFMLRTAGWWAVLAAYSVVYAVLVREARPLLPQTEIDASRWPWSRVIIIWSALFTAFVTAAVVIFR
ncbi:MAG TPA: hypothetical protein VK929_02115 [Longimicrobiales bacterium]|nr:hypothetical protein [Longimicrobiales bacterium]